MKKVFFAVIVTFMAVPCVLAGEYDFIGEHNKKSPIYQPGEKMVFTIKLLEDGKSAAGYKLKWKRTGDDGLVKEGEAISAVEGIKISTSTDKPGFVRIYITPFDSDDKQLTRTYRGKPRNLHLEVGACVGPETLKGLPEPKDFDVFWDSRKKLLNSVPLKVLEMVEVEGNDKVQAFDVKIACAGGMQVSGYLTMPKDAKARSLPAVVSYQGYGVRSSNKNLAAGQSSIFLDINAHGIINGQSGEFYRNLSQTTLKRYGLAAEGNIDREKSYFHDMMLRVMRSLEFVKSLPQWNGKDLTATGGSQGGMQSLIAAGLDKDVTKCYAWSPWNCDIGREKLGRETGGWGVEYTPAMEYYDPINHVKRANPKCELEIIANLGDYTCPPSGVWIAYNNFPGPKKMEVRQACQHSYRPKTFSTFVVQED